MDKSVKNTFFFSFCIDDQIILLEKNNKLVAIESPAFYDNNVELEKYINSLGVKLDVQYRRFAYLWYNTQYKYNQK